MAREYVVPATNFTNGAITAVWVNPGTTCSLEFMRAWASQSGSATSAQVRVQLSTQVTAFPTVVSTTPAKTKSLDPVSVIAGGTGSAGTAGTVASAEGGGAKSVIIPDAFNVLNGWLWVPTPPETIIMNASASSGLGLHFPSAPTSTSSWNAGLVYRELG